MDYIEKLLKNARQQKPEKIVTTLIILNKNNIFNTTRSRWRLGESVDGGDIADYSSSPMGQEYKSYKIGLNPLARGTVDLTLTGALGKGLTLKELSGTKFELLSTDEKYKKIGDKYGFKEFGLSDSEWLELQNELFVFAIETMLKRTYE